MYKNNSEIKKRRRELLEALLALEADEAVTIRADSKNSVVADRLNLRIPKLAIFESGGTAIAATALSKAEYQFVMALDSAEEIGLFIDDLIEIITGWNEEIGEENAAVLASKVNRKFRRSKIPFAIKSRKVCRGKFAQKIFFLSPQNHSRKQDNQI